VPKLNFFPVNGEKEVKEVKETKQATVKKNSTENLKKVVRIIL